MIKYWGFVAVLALSFSSTAEVIVSHQEDENYLANACNFAKYDCDLNKYAFQYSCQEAGGHFQVVSVCQESGSGFRARKFYCEYSATLKCD